MSEASRIAALGVVGLGAGEQFQIQPAQHDAGVSRGGRRPGRGCLGQQRPTVGQPRGVRVGPVLWNDEAHPGSVVGDPPRLGRRGWRRRVRIGRGCVGIGRWGWQRIRISRRRRRDRRSGRGDGGRRGCRRVGVDARRQRGRHRTSTGRRHDRQRRREPLGSRLGDVWLPHADESTVLRPYARGCDPGQNGHLRCLNPAAQRPISTDRRILPGGAGPGPAATSPSTQRGVLFQSVRLRDCVRYSDAWTGKR